MARSGTAARRGAVPFTRAVPMLTGWQVGQMCDDENVKRQRLHRGLRLDASPASRPATLHYTVLPRCRHHR